MKIKIPLVDLKVQYLSIKKDIDQAIRKVINKTDFIMGEEVNKFETAFVHYLRVRYAVGVSSGTDAIHLALLAIGIKKGDEVILPAHTFTATAEPVVWLGAKPVFVDIEERFYTIDPMEVEKKVTNKTKAIIPVHLYGHPVDMNKIINIAEKYNLSVIEDVAQAHGAEINLGLKTKNRDPRIENRDQKWLKVGTIGDIGIFSFYPGKNLGAYGDAGMVVTNNKILADKVRLLRNHGRTEKYTHLEVGFGNRIDTLQSAVLSVKLKYLRDWTKKRRKATNYYNKLLGNIKDIAIPYEATWARSVYHLYVIRAKYRDKLKNYLQHKGIETGIHYPTPLHLQPAYKFLGYHRGDFPITEKICREILSLPVYPELTKQQISYICQCIKDFYS